MDINWSDKNILIVEDENDSYLLLKTILRSTKANIHFVKDGQQAVDYIKSNEAVDLILMDIQMPVKNGLEATKEIKMINPNIPIIAETAFALEDDNRMCYKAGCDGYISKPINRKLLLKILSTYLDH